MNWEVIESSDKGSRYKCAVCGQKTAPTKLPPEKIRHECKTAEKPRGGVGTELHRLLRWIGFREVSGCKCKAHAKLMDANGIKWCESHQPILLGWLREEAEHRKLMFPAVLASQLIRLAVWRAKRQRPSGKTTAPPL